MKEDATPPAAPEPLADEAPEQVDDSKDDQAEDEAGGELSPRSEDDVFVDLPPEAPEPPSAEPEIAEPPVEEQTGASNQDDNDDPEKKSVQWAPGTPDPKPTRRPKKPAKGAKGKKKKSMPVNDGEDPDEIVAIVEGPGADPQPVQALSESVPDPAPIDVPASEDIASPVEEAAAAEEKPEIVEAPIKSSTLR